MSTEVKQETPQVADKKPSDTEFNFRKQEAKYEQLLQEERQKRLELEAKIKQPVDDSDEEDDEPYVDKRKLAKTLTKLKAETRQDTQSEVQKAVQSALADERRQNWLKGNPDFYEVMQHAQKFAEKDPDLAETILEMPDGFERQKLVYKNIKALGLHKKEEPKATIQDKIEASKRSPYYQPSGVGTAPYSSQGDYSPAGQQTAYNKMQELKNRLRLG